MEEITTSDNQPPNPEVKVPNPPTVKRIKKTKAKNSKKRVFKELPDVRIDLTPVSPPLLENGPKSDKKTEEIRAFEMGQDTWGGIDGEQGADNAAQPVRADGTTQTEVVDRLLDQTRVGKDGKKERPVAQLSNQDKAVLADHIRRLPKRSETPPPPAPPPTVPGILGKIRKLFGR